MMKSVVFNSDFFFLLASVVNTQVLDSLDFLLKSSEEQAVGLHGDKKYRSFCYLKLQECGMTKGILKILEARVTENFYRASHRE